MTDERPDSLAAQAASWVPPWERTTRIPDREYQASHAAPEDTDEPPAVEDASVDTGPVARADSRAGDEPAGGDEPDVADQPDAGAEPGAGDQPDSLGRPDEDEKADEAGLAADDDFDEAFEGPNPPGYSAEIPPELPPLPGEAGGPVTVDAPQELPGEDTGEPTDVGEEPELPLPDAIEEAAESPDEITPVDAPLPPDGDDAGDVFDAAADDDMSDDGELDVPIVEDLPDTEDASEPAADAEEPDDAEDVSEPAADAEEPDDAEASGASVGAEEDSEPAGRSPAGPGIPVQSRKAAGPTIASGDGPRRTEEEDLAGTDLRPMDDAELRAALEAVLLVVDEPVAEMQLAQIMEQPTERVAAMLEDISARYTAAGHGFDLRRVAGGWRLYTRPEYAPYVERFVLDGQSVRLTQAALETLAVVAYKQPVTRSRISAIRGVNCDGVMRTLVTRGLIEECGTESETGAFLYRTTALFLEKLGLNSVDQLPPLAPFLPDDVEEVLDASG